MTTTGTQSSAFHLISSTNRRGAETFAVDLVGFLAQRGIKGNLAALEPGSGPGQLPVPVLGPTRWSLGGLRAARKDCAEAQVAVGHGSSTLLALSVAGIGTGTPFVYRNIGDPLEWAGTWARRTRVSMFLKRARVVVTLWQASAVTLSEHFGVPSDRIAVIPNGCVGDHFPEITEASRNRARHDLGLPAERPVALYLGALAPEKAVDTAIGAVSRLDDWLLVIVGDGPERDRLEHLADSVAQQRVMFLPPNENPASVFAAADVVVLPSRTEGMPATVIEAGMSGLPVVASRVGGIPEIVIEGRTGFLPPVGDVEAFARTVEASFERRSELGSAARRHCLEHFEMNVVADAWERVLRQVAST